MARESQKPAPDQTPANDSKEVVNGKFEAAGHAALNHGDAITAAAWFALAGRHNVERSRNVK